METIRWLETDFGFDRWEALLVLSKVSSARIAEVIDPNYTVVLKFPTQYLPRMTQEQPNLLCLRLIWKAPPSER